MPRSREQWKTFGSKDADDVLKALTVLKGMFKTNQPLFWFGVLASKVVDGSLLFPARLTGLYASRSYLFFGFVLF